MLHSLVAQGRGPWHTLVKTEVQDGHTRYHTACGRIVYARRNVGMIPCPSETADLSMCQQCIKGPQVRRDTHGGTGHPSTESKALPEL